MKTRNLIIGTIIVLILLIVDMFIQIKHCFDYESQKNNGNNKWKIVENRIINMEEKINNIEI